MSVSWGCPYLDQNKHHLLITRIPNFQKLNKTTVTEKERQDAEQFFIRHHMDDESPLSRYLELVDSHGVLD